jgi:hypothetical protein
MPLLPEHDTTKKMRRNVGRQNPRVGCANLRSKALVDVTGIEPVTPCLQSIGFDSNRSIHY